MPAASVGPGESGHSITRCLRQIQSGQRGAEDRLLDLVYNQLRRMAGQRMRYERRDHTLQPTALANEVYLKLIGAARSIEWKDSAHFYATCAWAMRNILIDHARKRTGQQGRVELLPGIALTVERSMEFIALDDSLVRLARFDSRGAQVIELTFFLGLTQKEAAEVLAV